MAELAELNAMGFMSFLVNQPEGNHLLAHYASLKGKEGSFRMSITFEALNPRHAYPPVSILQSSRMLVFRMSAL